MENSNKINTIINNLNKTQFGRILLSILIVFGIFSLSLIIFYLSHIYIIRNLTTLTLNENLKFYLLIAWTLTIVISIIYAFLNFLPVDENIKFNKDDQTTYFLQEILHIKVELRSLFAILAIITAIISFFSLNTFKNINDDWKEFSNKNLKLKSDSLLTATVKSDTFNITLRNLTNSIINKKFENKEFINEVGNSVMGSYMNDLLSSKEYSDKIKNLINESLKQYNIEYIKNLADNQKNMIEELQKNFEQIQSDIKSLKNLETQTSILQEQIPNIKERINELQNIVTQASSVETKINQVFAYSLLRTLILDPTLQNLLFPTVDQQALQQYFNETKNMIEH